MSASVGVQVSPVVHALEWPENMFSVHLIGDPNDWNAEPRWE